MGLAPIISAQYIPHEFNYLHFCTGVAIKHVQDCPLARA